MTDSAAKVAYDNLGRNERVWFAEWVFDLGCSAIVGGRTYRRWLAAGLIQPAEEGYAATTTGREVASAIVNASRAKRFDSVRGRCLQKAPAE